MEGRPCDADDHVRWLLAQGEYAAAVAAAAAAPYVRPETWQACASVYVEHLLATGDVDGAASLRAVCCEGRSAPLVVDASPWCRCRLALCRCVVLFHGMVGRGMVWCDTALVFLLPCRAACPAWLPLPSFLRSFLPPFHSASCSH